LTSTPILLGTAQASFNSISTFLGTASFGIAPTAAGALAPVCAASTTASFLASPSYKTSIVYPVATVKGASSLAMSLAAATVLATLF